MKKNMKNQLENEFVTRYGRRSAAIVKYLAKGWSTERIARQFKISKTSVATYKSNFTRGVYFPFYV